MTGWVGDGMDLWRDLTDTEWILAGLISGPLEAPPHRGPNPARLMIACDGQGHGTTGCNLLRGLFHLKGRSLHHEGLAMTRRACKSLHIQETHMIVVLGGKPSVEITDDSLILRLEDQRGLRFLRPEAS